LELKHLGKLLKLTLLYLKVLVKTEMSLRQILKYNFWRGNMSLEFTGTILDIFALFFEGLSAILLIFGGLVAAMKIFLVAALKKPYRYENIRKELTNKILFGLELLIIGDILRTISDPSVNELLTVGVIVVIRTVLGYFLSKEVEEYHFD
jgi:uncharacterized membrane protein